MNRTLRDFKNSKFMIARQGESTSRSFWDEFIFNDCLALNTEVANASRLQSSSVGKGLLLTDASDPEQVFDSFQRYCKILVMARMPDIQDDAIGMLWGRPLSNPPVYYGDKHDELLNAGEWDATLAASQHAVVAGYATVRDMVVFELATVSSEQASLGWKGGRGWQYSLEYIHKVVNNNFIGIWEYWAGIALRDTCVFVSYDEPMPIKWQAESYYYPLYMLVYHNRFKLDCLSQSIIDYDMADALNGRMVRDEFQRFRNQYWFQDVTVDFQGVEIYGQMQHGMGLNEQYETVSSEISDVSDHLQEKWDRGSRTLLTTLAVLFAPLMEVWNTWVIPQVKEAPVEVLLKIAGAIVVVILLLVGWLRFRVSIVASMQKLSRKVRRMIGMMGHQ